MSSSAKDEIRERRTLSLRHVRLYCKQEGKGDRAIFLVHGDEANALIPKHLPDRIPFYAFHHMRSPRAERFLTIEEYASQYVDALVRLHRQGEIILAGYSIGGVIAYEMARLLAEMKRPVEDLILLDSRAPGLTSTREYHNRQFRWNESKTYKLVRKAWKKAIVESCQTLNLPIPRSQQAFYLMERYRKARSIFKPMGYDGSATLVRSTQDNFEDPRLGWAPHIESIQVHEIETDHHHITTEPAVREVAAIFHTSFLKKSPPRFYPEKATLKIAK